LHPEFWQRRWQSGQIAFHQSAVDQHLRQHWPDLYVAGNSRVFVPLCGKSLDLAWLWEQGHSVVGVELSAAALESFCMEQGVLAKRRTIDGFDVYEAARLQLYCGDIFKLSAGLLGAFSAVYDRAALIAWPPELRPAYVAHLSALTQAGTQTLLITVEYAQQQMSGPPFSVAPDDVDNLYSANHAIQELSRHDILASEPRMRARGLTRLQEVCYRLTRR
jgi:thiopurine S-methyltransferase